MVTDQTRRNKLVRIQTLCKPNKGNETNSWEVEELKLYSLERRERYMIINV